MSNQLTTLAHSKVEFIDGDRGKHYPNKSQLLDSGYCVFLNTSNVRKGWFDFSKVEFIDEVKDKQLRKGKVQNNDIILTTRGTVGNVAFVTKDMPFQNIRINSGMVIIRTATSTFDPYFLLLFFRSDLFEKQCLLHGSGSAQPQLPISALKHILLPDLDIKYQGKIVSTIRSLDKKIELNNQINAELEAMAKTLYDYWFVQFDFPDADGKPYKSSGGKMVYNKVLKREIPEGWNNGIIQELIDKVPSSNRVPAKEFKDTGEYPIIDQSQDFICGYTDDKSTVIKPETAHVIFGDHTRVVKLVNFNYARGADGTQVLIAKSDKVPSYLLYQIVSDIDLSNYGYARHYKFLKDTKCVIPNRLVAQRFQEKVKPFHEKIKDNIFQNQQLENLRDWLLPMLMNGQVTVK